MQKKFKSVILHVGIPKTGTTSIQTYCIQNVTQLREHGIHYPSSWPENHTVVLPYILDESYQNNRISPQKHEEYLNIDWLGLLDSEVEHTSAQHLLLSAEGISGYPISALQKLKSLLSKYADTIDVIVYLRHHVSLFESRLPQMLRTTNNITIQEVETILYQKISNYIKFTLLRLNRVYGREHVTVYSYENASTHSHSIVGHFLEHLAIPYINNPESIPTKNIRLSDVGCGILDTYRKQLLHTHKSNEMDNINQLLQIKAPPFIINEEQRNKIMTHSATDRNWVHTHYGIDYQDLPESTNTQLHHEEIDTASLFDTFSKLSPNLQDATISYLQQTNLLSAEKLQLLIQSQQAKLHVTTFLTNQRNFKLSSMYLACAFVLASHNNYASACKLLEYALIYHPDEPFLHKKLGQYNVLRRLEHTNGS